MDDENYTNTLPQAKLSHLIQSLITHCDYAFYVVMCLFVYVRDAEPCIFSTMIGKKIYSVDGNQEDIISPSRGVPTLQRPEVITTLLGKVERERDARWRGQEVTGLGMGWVGWVGPLRGVVWLRGDSTSNRLPQINSFRALSVCVCVCV